MVFSTTDRNVHANMPFGIKNAPVFNVYSDENGGVLVQKLYVEIADAIRAGKPSLRNSNNLRNIYNCRIILNTNKTIDKKSAQNPYIRAFA